MTPSFPQVKGRKHGYSIDAVDAFIAQARAAYDTSYAPAVALTSADIRTVSFPAERGGYSTNHVDAAIERLETAFAERERAVAIAAEGESNWMNKVREEVALLTARLDRGSKKRFTHMGVFEQGYSVKEVDAFSVKILTYLQTGESLHIDDVRSVVFRAKRGGYDEAQVDAVLDAVVAVMLALGKS